MAVFVGSPVTKAGVCSLFCLLLPLVPVQSATPADDHDRLRSQLLEKDAIDPGFNGSQSISDRPNQVVAQASSTKSRARKGDFDAEGQVSCAQERGQSMGLCKAAVARGINGDAAVAVTFANGFTRYLYFEGKAFKRASTTMSGSGKDIEWTQVDGLYTLRVDDQRFEIRSDFVLGE